MEAQFATLPTWLSVVDFENEFGKATEDETPVLVDVGGGKGQQILGLQAKSPSLKGRYIQETPAVLAKAPEEINKSTAITKIAYDFLTPNPSSTPARIISGKSSTITTTPPVSKSWPRTSPPCHQNL